MANNFDVIKNALCIVSQHWYTRHWIGTQTHGAAHTICTHYWCTIHGMIVFLAKQCFLMPSVCSRMEKCTLDILLNIVKCTPPTAWSTLACINSKFFCATESMIHLHTRSLSLPTCSMSTMLQNLVVVMNINKRKASCCVKAAIPLQRQDLKTEKEWTIYFFVQGKPIILLDCLEHGFLSLLERVYEEVVNQKINLDVCYVLNWCFNYGHPDVTMFCLKHLPVTSKDACYVLKECFGYGHPNITLYCLEHLPVTRKDVCADDNYALRMACANGHLEILQYMCSTFALTTEDARSKNNEAIRYASKHGHLHVVQYLIEHFSLTVEDIRTLNGFLDGDVIFYSVSHGTCDFVKYLVNHFSGLTKEDFITERLDSEALFPAIGHNAFCVACGKGDLDIVTYLVNKFKLTTKDLVTNYHCPLRVALKNGHSHVAMYLKDHFHFRLSPCTCTYHGLKFI